MFKGPERTKKLSQIRAALTGSRLKKFLFASGAVLLFIMIGMVFIALRADGTPGGYAVFDTPNYDGVDRKLFPRTAWGGYHFPRHATLFTPTTFAILAEKQGFRVERRIRLISPVFWVLSVHNAMIDLGAPTSLADKIHYQTLPLLAASTFVEVLNAAVRGESSNMRIVLRKPRGSKGSGA